MLKEKPTRRLQEIPADLHQQCKLAACKAAVPCLQDWIATTGFGPTNRRDREVLEMLDKAIAKAGKEG